MPAARGSRPDRLLDVSGPQERVQRRTMEQLVDSPPVVPSLDAPVPLMAEQLVDVLSLVAKYEKEMDRLEDLILTGAPVSSADREAWRRWVNRSSSSSGAKRKKKKRRKRKLPKAGGRAVRGQVGCRARCCATTRLGERSWCASATDHGRCGGDSACACLRGADRGVPGTTDHGGFLRAADHGGNCGGDSAGDKDVDMLFIVQRQLGETEQKTVEVPQFRSHGVVQFLDKVVDTPAGVQRQVLGSDSAENRGVSAVAALGRVCPGSAGQVFRALDDEEFFVIEGSLGVALTPGVSPRC